MHLPDVSFFAASEEELRMPVALRRSLLCLAVCAAFIVTVPSVTKAGPDEIPVKSFKNDHDTVIIDVSKDKVVDPSEVELVLKIAPALHWHKKIKAFASSGVIDSLPEN